MQQPHAILGRLMRGAGGETSQQLAHLAVMAGARPAEPRFVGFGPPDEASDAIGSVIEAHVAQSLEALPVQKASEDLRSRPEAGERIS